MFRLGPKGPIRKASGGACRCVQDGCSGCEQRCATAFGDVDDILEEYCDDCYSVPVDDSDPCKRAGCLDSEGTDKL